MKRALVLISTLGLLGCDNISLEGDAARPFACIPHAPADAGKQCSDGWSCGFDEKCFKLDSGQAESWRCLYDDECPSAWRCGAEVKDQRFCQQLDAGAPSPCNVFGDCQGGWRCGFEQVCFDPSILDGGSTRQCTDDTALQCPESYRCGERVGTTAFCLELDAGSEAPCNTDRGCEGGFRCDTRAHRCVQLTDVVTPGSLTNLRTALLSPLSNAPAPMFFAASGGVSTNALRQLGAPGVVFVSLDDGGVLTTVTQGFSGEVGKQQLRISKPVSAVRRLAVTSEGPVVFYADGSRERFDFLQDAGQLMGMTDFDVFTYEAPSPSPFPNQRLGIVKGGAVVLDPVPYSAGGANVLAASVWGSQIYAFTVNGGLDVIDIDGGFVFTNPRAPTPLITPGTPVSVVAGVAGSKLMPPNLRPSFLLVTPNGYQPWAPLGPEWVSSNQLLAPCSPGPMLQVSFSEDGNNPAAVIRCGRSDGGVYSVKQSFESSLNGLGARSSNVIDDLVPYRGVVVNQTAAPTVRAHAGANGRIWHALPETQASVLGERALRPLVLDRQPDVLLWVRASNTSALFASANGVVFSNVARNMTPLNLGFVSDLSPTTLLPLQTFSNRGRWLVATQGIIDVVASSTPVVVAQLPAGTLPLTAPVSAFVTTLGQREVVLLSSRDTIWAADVTGILGDPFAQPAVLDPVVVPQPGVRLRSLTLVPKANGVGGFVATSTTTMRFETNDLVRWSLSTVESPDAGLPVEVWADGTQGRVGTADGTIWSLPIMVALSNSLGNQLVAGDFARLCGEQFVTTSQGVQRLVAATDGGLPLWVPLTAVNAALDSVDSLKFYETTSESTDGGALNHQLYVSTTSGQIVEVLGDGACP